MPTTATMTDVRALLDRLSAEITTAADGCLTASSIRDQSEAREKHRRLTTAQASLHLANQICMMRRTRYDVATQVRKEAGAALKIAQKTARDAEQLAEQLAATRAPGAACAWHKSKFADSELANSQSTVDAAEASEQYAATLLKEAEGTLATALRDVSHLLDG